ncbi:aldo/keto reductase [Rhizobium sp. YK2]|uniref:aldo/keto reductase n=1 Tax=Rhizobium sp. YK2 TaxID=1860096 RepID=UPI00084CA6E7|nr:aldo/keto reductase [Rhizobium sp. YK2]OED00801.1 alcohol dehydrogenase [Rhizobium sp. YK2]
MDHVRLGRTGLKVSRLCLGCLAFGTPGTGPQTWSLSEEESRPFIKKALEAGINFFDTANTYSLGASEEILGRALKDYTRRDDVVIATKVGLPMRDAPNRGGLSRKAIMAEVDASLKRLGTDHIDLYQTHRWDYGTPIEETIEALHDVVKAGKVRYIGASSMFAWLFAKALQISRLNGWTEFVSMQNQLNLLYREEEREMLPLCEDEAIGVLPWSPLARGRLARAPSSNGPVSARDAKDHYGHGLFDATIAADRKVVEAVGAIAARRDLPQAQVALAWVLQKQPVVAPIIGATKLHHIDDALAALDVTLDEHEIEALEAPYVPHQVIAFS